MAPMSIPTQRLGAKDEAHRYGSDDRHSARKYHGPQRPLSADVHAAGVIRAACALHNAGYLPELAAHLVYNRVGGGPDGLHGEGGEDEGEQRPNEQANQHIRIQNVEDHLAAVRVELFYGKGVGGQQSQGC